MPGHQILIKFQPLPRCVCRLCTHVCVWYTYSHVPIQIESYWEEEEEPPTQQRQQQQHAVFPEAIPSSTMVAVSTPAETTPPLLSTTTTVDRDTNVQVVLDQK